MPWQSRGGCRPPGLTISRRLAEVLNEIVVGLRDSGAITNLINKHLRRTSLCPASASYIPQLSMVDLFGVIMLFWVFFAFAVLVFGVTVIRRRRSQARVDQQLVPTAAAEETVRVNVSPPSTADKRPLEDAQDKHREDGTIHPYGGAEDIDAPSSAADGIPSSPSTYNGGTGTRPGASRRPV